VSLFRYFTLPYWRRRRLKTFLTILGMASGIAVYAAIDLANRSALRSFETSVTRVSGKADLAVVGRERPLSDDDFRAILENSHTLSATPLIEIQGSCPPAGAPLTLLGIDPMSRADFFSVGGKTTETATWLDIMAKPRLAMVSRHLARSCGIEEGKEFEVLLQGQRHRLQARFAKTGDSDFEESRLIFVDIATAQEILQLQGRLDRVEVRTRPGETQAWIQDAESTLKPGLSFSSQTETLGRGRELLKAFQLNLLSLGLVAIFVAAFIVYNSASLSVLHRRADLAVLRALGASRRQLGAAFALETLVSGTLSAVLGVCLGTLLAKALFGEVSQTVHNLYLSSTELKLHADLRVFLPALALALGASALGSFLPLLEVLSIGPAEGLRRLGHEGRLRRHPLVLATFAALMFVAALLSAKLSSIRHPAWGFATAFAVLSGFLALTPGVMKILLSGIARLVRWLRWGFSQIACAQIAENPYRYGVVTAALALGVALWLGVSLMIVSFRSTVVDWIEGTIRGDLYLNLKDNQDNGFRSFLPENFLKATANIPGVERRDAIRRFTAWMDRTEIPVSAIELRQLFRDGKLKTLAKDDRLLESPSGETMPAAISESLARRQNLQVGDEITLATEWGNRSLKIASILYDYSSERGLIYVDRQDFAQWSHDGRIQGLALYLHNPDDSDRLSQQIRDWPSAPPTLEVRPNREVRGRILKIFDETFQVTEALKLVSLFVAFLGILSTLSILMEEKRREIGLMQSLGMTPLQLSGYGLSQGAALGLCGWFLGSICGIALAWVIIRVINYDHFGWTIFFRLDPRLLAKGFVLTLAVAIVATVWPMRYLRKIKPSEALRFEE